MAAAAVAAAVPFGPPRRGRRTDVGRGKSHAAPEQLGLTRSAGRRADGRADADAHFVHMPASRPAAAAERAFVFVAVVVFVGPELNLGDIPC